ncbi:MAG: CHASE3 domain-containing protein [Magnetococcales bacterium]|nr:CHASE3 domain-containing protein [Magnetococcales bacterium]
MERGSTKLGENITLQTWILSGYAITLVAILIYGWSMFYSHQELQKSNQRLEQNHLIMVQAIALTRQVVDMETGLRGFLITGDEDFLEPYRSGRLSLATSISDLSRLIQDDIGQLNTLAEIERIVSEWHLRIANPEIHLRYQINRGELPLIRVSEVVQKRIGKKLMDTVRQHINAFISHEQKRNERRRLATEKDSENILYLSLLGALAAILIGATVIMIVIRSAAGPLTRMAETMSQLAKSSDFQLTADMVPSVQKRFLSKEVLLLNNTFYTMASRIDQSIKALNNEISQRKRVEVRVRNYSKMLAESNKDLESFAYVTSHDLQEPLRKIRAFGSRLQTQFAPALGEQGNDYLIRMISAADRMQQLINDLLALSRVTSKAKPFIPTPLSKTIEEVISDLETTISQASGIIEVDTLPTIHADSVQMRQLFQNLIGNALKYRHPDRTPEIRILNCGKVEEDGEFYEFTVSDNGIGFEQKYAKQIFGVFQRLHGRKEYAGSGIGLAICQKIVNSHNGHIHAQSEPDKGTVITIRLPLSPIKDDTHEQTNT